MINPHKKASKINPQIDGFGYRIFAKPVFDALMRADLTKTEYKVCFSIIGRTWGYKKLSAVIAISTIMEDTDMTERTIRYTAKSLRERCILYYESSGTFAHGKPLNEYLFNKHFDTWRRFDKKLKQWVVDNSVDKVVDNLLKGAKVGKHRCKSTDKQVQGITPDINTNTISNPKKRITDLTRDVFKKSEYAADQVIEERLSKIATKEGIKRVLSLIDQQLWFKVERYLAKRYPRDGSRSYKRAVDEIDNTKKEEVTV